MADDGADRRAPKRQARGERRIAQIIDAAAELFAENGYESVTTNAIAARAGISPGSLYQFFANKDAIVRALTERYVSELSSAHTAALEGDDLAALPLDALVDTVLTPLVEFNRSHRAFKALFARTGMPQTLEQATAPLHQGMLDRITALLVVRSPGTPEQDVRRVALVTVQVVKALMPLAAGTEHEDRAWYDAQLRLVLVSYLAGALGAPGDRAGAR
ncbi:TetR/AcrR family transcriptional regulator [Isoptericola variabilis]|uniref:Regulatory protein TetR n=1 Tax=Isoptericola variabilis (strain 225) TaxID=743718 RepID=F6FVY6_ISOV2|nr:TetR/AcrR family transcriptional regulator [Isoptericola variabilis]AEG44456.1 regulatory protein TetR [Isoptericola variabilis 225]TWH28270.1 TetR family transcriptional regulator [Isoptericola variabilis J7]